MNNNLFIKYAKPLTEEEKARLVVFYEDAKTLVRLKVKKPECPLELLFIAEDVAIAKYNRIGSEGISQESVDVVSTTYTEDLLAPYQEVSQSYINASSGRLVAF